MKKTKVIDVNKLNVNESVEHSFNKKDFNVNCVTITDVNKLIIRRREHSEKGHDFLSIKVLENDIERANFVTSFRNVELVGYDYTLYFELKEIDKKRDPQKGEN